MPGSIPPESGKPVRRNIACGIVFQGEKGGGEVRLIGDQAPREAAETGLKRGLIS